jgi:hypothetical protein
MSKPENYAAFYALLNRMFDPDKEELKKTIVLEYTSGRTDSLREMTLPEYLSALKGMEKLVVPDRQEQIISRKRHLALLLLKEYGINTADWNRINAFCSDSRIAGKVFKQLNADELDALREKMHKIIRKKNTKLYINNH